MRYLALKIIAVFCVLIISLFVWKWHTWFGCTEEASYVTPNVPNRIMLSLGEDADFDRAISWRCDTVLSKGWIELLELSTNIKKSYPAKGKLIESCGGKNAFYRVNLKNLRYGNYRYKLTNGDKESEWHEFSVNKKDNNCSFVYLGDIQDTVNGVSDTIFNHISNKYPNLDFWMFAGDAVERPMDKYWNEFSCSGQGIFDRKPIIGCTGNHDYHKGLFKVLDNRWKYYWPLPKNGPNFFKGRACHWEIENACIISLDTDGVQGPGTYFSQYYWARRILRATDKEWKIVFLHHPLESAGKGRSTIIMKTLFKDMLAEEGVDVVLQGHDHSYSRYTNKNDGLSQTPAYVVSSCSRKSYDISIDDEADRLGSSIKLYQIINVSRDTLSFKSFTIDDEYYDGFSIARNGLKKNFMDENPRTAEKLEPTYRLKKKKNKAKLESYLEDVAERRAS